jgi:hypothetical protein
MARNASWHWMFLGLILTGCGPQSEHDEMADEIARSIRVGEDAADAKPGYGFDLYPGADVVSSLMDGMSMTIQTDDSIREIGAFYEDQLIKKGWQIENREITDEKITLSGAKPETQQEIMRITAAKAERGQGHVHLIFVKLISDR